MGHAGRGCKWYCRSLCWRPTDNSWKEWAPAQPCLCRENWSRPPSPRSRSSSTLPPSRSWGPATKPPTRCRRRMRFGRHRKQLPRALAIDLAVQHLRCTSRPLPSHGPRRTLPSTCETWLICACVHPLRRPFCDCVTRWSAPCAPPWRLSDSTK